MDTSKRLHVNVTRQDDSCAIAKARNHQIPLNIKKGSGEAGFNAAETLLAALSACLLTNINAIGAKMHLKIDDVRIEYSAERSNEPPIIKNISYRLILKSSESPEKLAELHELSRKWGTVTNTVIDGSTPQGELVIEE